MENEKSYVEETIRVMRPTNRNRIFNEADYDVITTTDTTGEKLVILREKQGDNKTA